MNLAPGIYLGNLTDVQREWVRHVVPSALFDTVTKDSVQVPAFSIIYMRTPSTLLRGMPRKVLRDPHATALLLVNPGEFSRVMHSDDTKETSSYTYAKRDLLQTNDDPNKRGRYGVVFGNDQTGTEEWTRVFYGNVFLPGTPPSVVPLPVDVRERIASRIGARQTENRLSEFC